MAWQQIFYVYVYLLAKCSLSTLVLSPAYISKCAGWAVDEGVLSEIGAFCISVGPSKTYVSIHIVAFKPFFRCAFYHCLVIDLLMRTMIGMWSTNWWTLFFFFFFFLSLYDHVNPMWNPNISRNKMDVWFTIGFLFISFLFSLYCHDFLSLLSLAKCGRDKQLQNAEK